MDLLLESLASAATQVEVNAIKVCIDTLKWKISRFYPRMYGIGLGHETACAAPDSQYDMSLLTDGEVRELRLLLTKCLAKKGRFLGNYFAYGGRFSGKYCSIRAYARGNICSYR